MSDADDEHAHANLPSAPPGAIFDKYEIVRLLGSGGMGSVHEARHVELGKRVAIKLLSRKLAKNKVYLERFLREGRIAARLDHPHVVDVFDVGTWEGTPFLVMEHLSGTDLDDHLRERGILEPAEAIDLLLPILSALDGAHRVGLVHRDIKPANIFLARAPHGGIHPKLLDFGIAKPNDEDEASLTATTDVFGTPQYMAPEQVRRSRDATSRADQYAVGAVLYRCLTGCEAFPAGTSSIFELLERVVAGGFPPPREVRPELPALLDAVIVRSMARRPEERFVSVRDLGAALLPYASPRARQTWESAFASPGSMADTLAPEAASTADRVVTVISSPSLEETPAAIKSEPGPETLVAASSDTRAPGGPAGPARDRSRSVILGGVVLGALAAALAVFALGGTTAVGGRHPSATPASDAAPAPDVHPTAEPTKVEPQRPNLSAAPSATSTALATTSASARPPEPAKPGASPRPKPTATPKTTGTASAPTAEPAPDKTRPYPID